MTTNRTRSSRVAGVTLVGVAAASASGLIFEIALTRVFAITQFYHFAFLTVSMALLGFGASGSLLAAFPVLGRGGPRRWATLATLQGVATVGAYLVANELPFDSFAIAFERIQFVYLAVYYLTLAIPFFFGGLIVAVLLSGTDQPEPVRSHRVYGASLVGSGLGCVVAIVVIDRIGGEGTILLAAALAAGAGAGFASLTGRRTFVGVASVVAVGLLVLSLVPPAVFSMNLSPYKGLEAVMRFPGAEVMATEWERGTRIDLVASDAIRSVPGLSFSYVGAPPVQDGVTFDGDDLSPVPRAEVADSPYAGHMLSSLVWALRPDAAGLVLEPRGGLDVLVALAGNASSVTAVEPHAIVIDLIEATGASVYDDERVDIVASDPRTYVERSGDRFDVIDLALNSPYRPVTSGAYSLAETYTLTVEAFGAYLDRLGPDGIFSVVRWVQTPPSEETRLLAIAAEAVRRLDIDPAEAVAMLRNYSNVVLLVQPDGWSPADVEAIREFAIAERFDIVAMPGLDPTETNRFSVIPDEQYSQLAAQLLVMGDPAAVYAASSFAITPPTDDHPFFGHYFQWNQTGDVLDSLGRTWQPFGGAGYLVLVAFLLLAVAASAVLIVAPLGVSRGGVERTRHGLRWWVVGYFGMLGLAFLLVEIPLIQLYILLIGDPTTAFAVVLFAVLLASGVGSMLSPRVPWRTGAVVVTGLAVAYPFLIRGLTTLVLPAALPLRIVAGALAIVPLGLAMGVMFPHGIAFLETRAPHLIPWAWGINGTLSVVSAVAAALLALAFGFTTVLAAGAAAYALAMLLTLVAVRLLGGAGEGDEDHATEVLAAE